MSTVQDKRILCSRVKEISVENNIASTVVNKIINSYIKLLRSELVSGRIIDVFGLVRVEPDYIVSDYIGTLSYYARIVSNDTSVSFYTVKKVIEGYIDSMRHDLIDGLSVSIRGIVSLHPISDGGKLVTVHSSISVSIKQDLLVADTGVTGARAFTSRHIRRMVRS